jgi:hypothetical protein
MAAINDLIRKVGITPVPKNKKKRKYQLRGGVFTTIPKDSIQAKKPPINTPSMALSDMRLREHKKEYELYKLKRKRKGSEGYSPQGEPDYDPDFRRLDLDRRMKITPEALELRRRPKYQRFNI